MFKVLDPSLGEVAESEARFTVIGTVLGDGWNCGSNNYRVTEGTRDGIWNRVAAHMDWILPIVKEADSTGKQNLFTTDIVEI